MQNRSLVAALAAIALGSACPAPACPSAFFPKRPAHAPVRYETGVFIDMSGGSGSGTIQIRTPRGARYYYVGSSLTIDGRDVVCAVPPAFNAPPDYGYCFDWPPYLVGGVTKVRLATFTATRAGEQVDVADRLDVVDDAPYYGRYPSLVGARIVPVPVRGTSAHTKTTIGVIDAFTNSPIGGWLRLRTKAGTQRFAVSPAVRARERRVQCLVPPRADFVPGKRLCSRWPADVAIGSTLVRVTSYPGIVAGRRIDIVDRIDDP